MSFTSKFEAMFFIIDQLSLFPKSAAREIAIESLKVEVENHLPIKSKLKQMISS